MRKTTLLITMILIISGFAKADTVVAPVKVTLARQDAATRSIPRWKGYMSPTNPDEVWLGLANWGSTSTHLAHTIDGGSSYNAPVIWLTDNHICDNHLSIDGDSSANVYAVMPEGNDLLFRKINYPGRAASDMDPLRTVMRSSGLPRANVMIEPGNQRIWVFTRVSGVPAENVRYHYSDNGGVSWTSGIADPTFADEVRIGSMPYVDGRPALVVAYMGSTTMGYRYYLWNGSQFEAQPDAQIYTGSLGYDRHFAHNVTSGNVMHMLFALGNTLYHYWKPFNNGTGSWNVETIDSSPYMNGVEWETSCTVRGSDLYVLYSKKTTSSGTSAEIFYSKWSESSPTWTTPTVVSIHAENTDNHWPNSVRKVPMSSDYIPVFWYSHLGANSEQVYAGKIMIDDITVTPLDIDRKIKEFKEGTATEQEVFDLIQIYKNSGGQ